MPTMWSLTEKGFKFFIAIGAASSLIGITVILVFKTGSLSGTLLGFGSAELMIGVAGYFFGTSSEKNRKTMWFSVGIVSLIGGTAICSLQAILDGIPPDVGLIGMFVFSLGIPVILFQLTASKPVNLTGLNLFGIGLFVAGLPIMYFFGLVPSMNDYLNVSILPLLSGGEIFVCSHVGRGFRNLSEKFAINNNI